MKVGPKTRIKHALAAVNREIAGHACRGGRFAGGLSREGYSGGYADALMDVQLLMNGVTPNRRDYWEISEIARKAGKAGGRGRKKES